MVKRPSTNSMSATPASRTWAAICLPFSITSALASDDGRAARHDRLRAAGAAAGDQPVAVALHQADLVEGHAEAGAQHLREGRPVALAIVQRAGDDGDSTIWPRNATRPFRCWAARSLRGSSRCRARAACRASGLLAAGHESPSSPRPQGHGRECRGIPAVIGRCQPESPRAVGPGSPCCAGAVPPCRCPSRQRQRRSAAP